MVDVSLGTDVGESPMDVGIYVSPECSIPCLQKLSNTSRNIAQLHIQCESDTSKDDKLYLPDLARKTFQNTFGAPLCLFLSLSLYLRTKWGGLKLKCIRRFIPL